MAERKKFDKAFKEQTVEKILAGEATASLTFEAVKKWTMPLRKWAKSMVNSL